MSSDMMLIYEEELEGKDCEAIFIDECSIGKPWSDFGKWFQDRFCGAPSLIEQMCDYRLHHFTAIRDTDVVSVKHALKTMNKHSTIGEIGLILFFENNVGKKISTENW